MFESKIDNTPDAWEQELMGIEADIARLRHRQLGLLHRVDVAQVATADGARSLQEWTAARLDVTSETAAGLVATMRSITPDINDELAAGAVTFDRAAIITRLAASGADESVVNSAAGRDLAGVRRLVSGQRRITSMTESEAFDAQYLMVQPSLDEAHWRLSGLLGGFEGRIVEKAIQERADALRGEPDEPQLATGPRRALALVAISQDALECHVVDVSSRGPVVTVVVDADLAGESGGGRGAEIVGGPRIGPRALDELLCTGRIEWNRHDADGNVVALGQTTSSISPRLRRAVLARDGACTADGCNSRYRLEVHHIVHRRDGGADIVINLGTFCWYHHIVVIHRMGLIIDPASPPLRRRFLRRDGPG